MEVKEKPKSKVSVYSKRNSMNGEASPAENDSEDPEFRSGPVSEKKKIKRKTGKRQNRDSMDDLSDASAKPSKKKRKTKAPPRKPRRHRSVDDGVNPLLEFFKNVNVQPVDSSDDEPDDEPSYDAEESDGSDEDVENKLNAAPANKFAPYANRKVSPSLLTKQTGETTEEDSDVELPVAIVKRKFSPRSSKSKTATDSEATEPDSSSSELVATKPLVPKFKAKTKPAPNPDSDPEKTESDTDEDQASPPLKNASPLKDVRPPKDLCPRPGFPLNATQSLLGPLVLDAKQGIQVPAAINTYLRDYQRDGVKFFWERYNEGRGGLLGDDMGLGKTIQVISFLSAIMGKEGVRTDRRRRRKHVAALQEGKEWRKNKTLPPANATWPTCLIIAPTTVVMNWAREFETWGYFEVSSYTGKRSERSPILNDFKMGRLDVVLTSIDIARRDIDDLMDLPWSCIFVDEVHTVKNPKSKTSVAFNEFQCIRRFGLTGTAIQNSYDELWTLLDWTSPGAVGSMGQWRGIVSNPLKLGQSATATDNERARAVIVSESLRDNLLPRFFIRRTKDIIAHQLPKKTDEVVFCPLTTSQIQAYKRILAMDEIQSVLARDEPCPCGSKKRQLKCCIPFDITAIFKFMSILIKLSNHLGLILPGPDDNQEQRERNRELRAVAFPDPAHPAPTYTEAIMDPKYCGKWKVLLSLLKRWKKDDSTNKVLIFTKSVKLLDMLAYQLQAAHYGFLKLDGSVKQEDRMAIIDQFHYDPAIYVFLISTMAGGTGLNLTGANKVVIFDPNWNPAHDLQAMDRAFRFGQTRDVSVIRLLGAGSVEELIYARQIYKQQQMQIGYNASIQTRYFAGVQGDKSRQGELFGLKNIFKLHEGGLATKTAIENAYVAELDWALSSMQPQTSTKRKSDVNVPEVEGISDLKGLGALLFDDGPSPDPNAAKATVRGMYTHQNPHLLVSSKIEQERTRNIVAKSRRRPKKSDVSDDSPGAAWPPVRIHKSKGPLEFSEKRAKALIGTGMIKNAAELGDFARRFAIDYTEEERAWLISRLDAYQGDSDDSQDDGGSMEIEPEPEDIDMDD
ncbi:P-loop containing nucleoside triphosphate hydrolase protein [Mycena galopus ATCC 62051]|nr:P-loop containing nucleoside triphosphate hydrolase protein [Mycena galopus ATCC 62051]